MDNNQEKKGGDVKVTSGYVEEESCNARHMVIITHILHSFSTNLVYSSRSNSGISGRRVNTMSFPSNGVVQTRFPTAKTLMKSISKRVGELTHQHTMSLTILSRTLEETKLVHSFSSLSFSSPPSGTWIWWSREKWWGSHRYKSTDSSHCFH